MSKFKKHVRGEISKTVGNANRIVLKSVKEKIEPARIVEVPKSSSILPLIPFFAGFSALETLTGESGAVARAINSAKSVNG